LTLLLVVAMAFQLCGNAGGVALLDGGTGHGCGGRVVQELPALAHAQIARRSAQQDRRVPAEAVGLVRFPVRHAVPGDLSSDSQVAGPTRAPLFGELDLPPPALV
jgi:hypothetical protein